MKKTKTLTYLKKYLPYLISFVLIYFLYQKFEVEDLKKVQGYLKLDTIIISMLIYLVIKFFNTLRYKRFFSLSLPTYFIFYLITFANLILNLLPFRAGEISYIKLFKKYDNKRYLESSVRLIALRVIDYAVIFFFFILSLLLLSSNADVTAYIKNSAELKISLLVLTATVIIITTIMIFLGKFPFSGKIAKVKNELFSVWRNISLKVLLSTFILSIIYWSLRFGQGIFLSKMVGIEASAEELLFISTILMILSALPIQTFAGFGLFEGGWILSLQILGYSGKSIPNQILAVHILNLINVVGFGIIASLMIKKLANNINEQQEKI